MLLCRITKKGKALLERKITPSTLPEGGLFQQVSCVDLHQIALALTENANLQSVRVGYKGGAILTLEKLKVADQKSRIVSARKSKVG